MKKDIVVIGGYGHVGAQICRLLGERFPGDVYAAGRNLANAEQFCRSTGGKVKPLRLALGEPVDEQLLQRVKLVVMCLDQQDTSFVQLCLMNGIDYVDVSANGSFLRQVEALDSSGELLKAAAVLSVGLAPGLTNLLAGLGKLALDQTNSIDIAVMLGLGDSHGKAAIEWTVDNLSASFPVMEKGHSVVKQSFTGGKKTDFGNGLGQRTAYRFPFSDQQTLPGTLKVPSVSTRLCFDSRLTTASIALLQKLGVMALLRKKRWRNAAVKSFGTIRLGTEQFAVKVDVAGYKDGVHTTCEYGIQGTQESAITACTAAIVASTLYQAKLPAGVFHLEQLFVLTLYEDHLSLNLAGHTEAGPDHEIHGLRCWSRQGQQH